MRKTPMQTVKERFQGKEKLVDALLGLVERSGGLAKEELRKKLLAQSNKKLLALHRREELIRERFGSRAKMVDALLTARQGKASKEDAGLRRRLEALTSGQLLDLARRHRLVKA